MIKSSLRYRAAQRRAFKTQPITYKPTVYSGTVNRGVVAGNTSSAKTWQPATYVGFNAESGQHQVKTWTGEVAGVTRIPGSGAEFGGVAVGGSGLLSQGFWSH